MLSQRQNDRIDREVWRAGNAARIREQLGTPSEPVWYVTVITTWMGIETGLNVWTFYNETAARTYIDDLRDDSAWDMVDDLGYYGFYAENIEARPAALRLEASEQMAAVLTAYKPDGEWIEWLVKEA